MIQRWVVLNCFTHSILLFSSWSCYLSGRVYSPDRVRAHTHPHNMVTLQSKFSLPDPLILLDQSQQSDWLLGTGKCFIIGSLTSGEISFALYCVLENKYIKSATSSLLLTASPGPEYPAAGEVGEKAISLRRQAVEPSRTWPSSNTTEPCPVDRPDHDRPGHPLPPIFLLNVRLEGLGGLCEFRIPNNCSTSHTEAPWQTNEQRGCHWS